jgi:hypothetical protein
MIKFVSDLLQAGGVHDKSLPVTCYRLMVFLIKLASDLLQVGSCHDKVGQLLVADRCFS